MPCNIKNPANIDLTTLEPHVNGLYNHFAQKYGFKKPPVVVFDSDPSNQSNVLGKTAYYDPSTLEIHIYTDGRHPKDMLRSIAHELIHHRQNLEGRLNVGGYHGEGYYLKNEELKKLEQEAMKDGNETLREYEDGLKLKRNNKMSLKEWKNNELNMCALEVTHKSSGLKGHPIKHTLSESGNVSHYTVEFENAIVENIAVDNLDIVVQEMHSHKRDDEKPHDKKKPIMSEDELEEAAKPDFLDLDKDGNREEPMKDAANDADNEETSEASEEEKDLETKHKNENLQENIKRVLKNNKKLRLRFK